MSRRLTFAEILRLLNRVKDLLASLVFMPMAQFAWHVHTRLHLLLLTLRLLLLNLADALDGVGEKRGAVARLYKVRMGTARIELRLDHQIGLLRVERACRATPSIHDELMFLLHLA